jgi:hypothetical protein
VARPTHPGTPFGQLSFTTGNRMIGFIRGAAYIECFIKAMTK